MGEKIIIGPIDKGLKTNREPFVIDNDSFPTLLNAYQWRGRVKRKRGTTQLDRLQRTLGPLVGGNTFIGQTTSIFNLFTFFSVTEPNKSIVPGNVLITIGAPDNATFQDNGMGGFTVTGIGIALGSTINYLTGAVVLNFTAASGVSPTTLTMSYFPSLPVMGFRDLLLNNAQYPGNLAFDTTYSYNVSPIDPFPITDVTFYKNPVSSGTYTAKSSLTPFVFNGKDYQQFWTINYQNALWATNGLNVPFIASQFGMQFAPLGTIIYVSNTVTTLVLTITNCPLVIGDFVYFNEWTVGGNIVNALNYQTGYVTASSTVLGVTTLTITFPNTILPIVVYVPGIVQYLTNTSDPTRDCLKWYDGDPTIPGNGQGWVNFCPPLINLVGNGLSIADQDPTKVWYLIGAKIIFAFKNRIIFFGPIIQTSSAGSQVYLEDTIIYSEDGTPYYTTSFQGSPLTPTTFQSLLVPNNQSAFPAAFFEDQTGFGGFTQAGIAQAITTVSTNEDALIVGFNGTTQMKMCFTGNDIVPFLFYIINSELGSGSTFSAINTDDGVVTKGTRGFIITSQTSCQRFDLDIPDQVFEISNVNNGAERFCSQRDFIDEWAYFTYASNESLYKYPSQTLQFNYRDNSWAIFNENYTTYGTFRKQTGQTWLTIPYRWIDWNTPWNEGSSDLLEPVVVGGNQQGYLMIRDPGITSEDFSLYIQNIAANVVTSPNHCLINGDFILINGAIGTVSQTVNGKIFTVTQATTNTFTLSPPIASGTYSGLGQIKRYYVPFIQTKQFPTAWGMSRKTRLGSQQYLLSRTDNAQITLNIYLSQDDSTPYNEGTIVPAINSQNNSLIYSNILYTCPESRNLGLTPFNINLQTPTASTQAQIWHRINTSLIGDTVQLGFTISNDQMITFTNTGLPVQITGVSAPGYPTVLTSTAAYDPGQMIRIDGVLGETQLNFSPSMYNYYYVLSSTPTTVSIDIDSTTFSAYIALGTTTAVNPVIQEAEVELHGIILDCSPSQLLC